MVGLWASILLNGQGSLIVFVMANVFCPVSLKKHFTLQLMDEAKSQSDQQLLEILQLVQLFY